MIPLSSLRDSFEGVIPSIIATVDDRGIPNISYLSHVHYVDDGHVALSNQFFSKTAANIRTHGIATVMVVDGRTGRQHVLDLQFDHACDSGAMFTSVSTHLDVVSAIQGAGDVMKLRSADIYRVTAIREIICADPVEPDPPVVPCDRLGMAARLAAAIAAEEDADTLLDVALDGLRDALHFANAVVLLRDAGGLSTVGSRGYDRLGAGAEVRMGDGLIGKVAETGLAVRIADTRRARRYAAASAGEPHTIPLPALAQPRCQMAVPMQVRGQVQGVIFVESDTPFAFGHEDEAALSLVAHQLASALHLAELHASKAAPTAVPPPVPPPAGAAFAFRYFTRDDSVFIGDDYLIKGMPGRLLYHFVKAYADSGRRDFSNREIRRETSLKLPDFKDNLEARLILLRRRLEDKAGPIALSRPDRGQIRLDVTGLPVIEVVADGG